MKNYLKYVVSLSLPMALLATTVLVANTNIQQRTAKPIDSELQAKLPEHYPDKFVGTGLISNVNTQERIITLGTTGFVYGINLKVHTLTSNFGSITNLTRGTSIGYSYYEGADKTLFLTEAWVFPQGSMPDF